MNFPRKTISASLISAYYNCPLEWKLINVDGLIPKVGDALDIGSMFDLAVKLHHKDEDPFKAIEEKFSHLENYKKHLKLIRQLYLAYSFAPYNFTHPTFDVGFKITLDHPITGEIIQFPLTGFLDALDTIDGGAHVVEYKTSSAPYTQQQVDESIQATIYSYYIYKTLGVVEPIVHYIVADKKSKTIQVLQTTRSIEDFCDLFEKVKQFIIDVESEKFDKNINHPFWCQCEKL